MTPRRTSDSFSHKARREGYPARSVYKLEEIDRRVRLFRQGQRVLDLGAYPGSWLIYAAKKVGPSGRVFGLDLQDYEGALPKHARFLCADLREELPADVQDASPYDVVMSDMAPATTGHRHLDMVRSYELAMIALSVAEQYLKPNGAFVAKIFQGEDYKEAKNRMARTFVETRTLRPKATRKESYEVFLFGRKIKPGFDRNGGPEKVAPTDA